MRYIKGFIAGVLTVFAGIFLLIRWAWKKTNMTEDYVIPRLKDEVINFICRLLYGTDCYICKKRYPQYSPRYVHYTDYRQKDGDKYSNPAWKGYEKHVSKHWEMDE